MAAFVARLFSGFMIMMLVVLGIPTSEKAIARSFDGAEQTAINYANA